MSSEIYIPEDHKDLEKPDYLLFLVEFSSDIEELKSSSIEISEPKKLKSEEKMFKYEYHERNPNKSSLF
jgi:hypothetical protein